MNSKNFAAQSKVELLDMNNHTLCWLATVDAQNHPNVSPKEMFYASAPDELIIAHIQSPKSIRNIKQNPQVCVSSVNIFLQKGIQAYGLAQIESALENGIPTVRTQMLYNRYGTRFKIESVIVIHVKHLKPVFAPSYGLGIPMVEEELIATALTRYLNHELPLPWKRKLNSI